MYNKLLLQGRPRHSQSQGLVEHGNRTVEEKLAAIKYDLNIQDGEHFHWAKHLPRLMYTLNTQTSKTTKDTPYHLVFGQAPHCAPVHGLGSRVITEDQLDALNGKPPVDTTPELPPLDTAPELPPPVDTTPELPPPVDTTP